MPLWKRLGGFVLLLAISVWLAAMGLQTIAITCEGHACVHEVRYAGITTRVTPFTASRSTVSWRRTGKGNNLGVVDIKAASGEVVRVDWLSPGEAEAAATAMIQEASYRLASNGPRWWLLFLLATVPWMWSLVAPPKLRIPSLVGALPIARTKKAARAARGKANKARERG